MVSNQKQLSASIDALLVSFLLCLSTLSCDSTPSTDSRSIDSDRPWQLTPPMIVTEPVALNFSEKSDTKRQDDNQIVFTEAVSLFNTGEMPLKIISVRLAVDDACTFRISSSERTGALLNVNDSGDSYDLVVDFSPSTTKPFKNRLIIETNSAMHRIVEIPVFGQSNNVPKETSSCSEDNTAIVNNFDFCDDSPALVDISGHRKYHLYRDNDILRLAPAVADFQFEQTENDFNGTISVPDLSWNGEIWGTVSGNTVCFTGFVPGELSPNYIEGRFEYDDEYNMNNMFVIGYSLSESSNGIPGITGICIDEDDADDCSDGKDNDFNGLTDCEDDKCAEFDVCLTETSAIEI